MANNNAIWWLVGGAIALAALSSTPTAAVGKASKLKVFKKIRLYKEPGKTNVAWLQGRTGCYIIYENGKKVYVGYSGYNLYKTLIRHFNTWNHKYQKVVTYVPSATNKYHVTIILATPKQAQSLEYQLIQRFLPRDNTQKYPELWPDKYDNNIAETFNQAVKELKDAPF